MNMTWLLKLHLTFLKIIRIITRKKFWSIIQQPHTMDKKHVLILGASGFVGSRLFQLLTQMQDQYRITISVHKTIPSSIPSGVRVLEGSLDTLDLSLLENDRPDIIFHLARINSTRFGRFGRLMAGWKGYRANMRLLKYMDRAGWKVSLVY